mmetsp:Transcript_2547/g.9235  ORF Transcript_2547/g.9235 Transcript_2547/m.9235 type:complete len:111 (+) Transcript_2547:8928-9260(+)
MHFVLESRATKNGEQVVHLPVVTGRARLHVNFQAMSTLVQAPGVQPPPVQPPPQRFLHLPLHFHPQQKVGAQMVGAQICGAQTRWDEHAPFPPTGTSPKSHTGTGKQLDV